MKLTIEQALQQAVTAHKEGKLQDAERLYRAILQSQPAHPNANHNLGVLAVSVNQAEAALPLFKTALEANPKIEQFWLSYIDALIKENQFDNAKQVLEQAKKQGIDGEKLNTLEAKLASINQPENINSLSPSQQQLKNLLEHYQNGRFADAEKLAVSITQEFPRHNFSWKILGAVLGQTGRNSEALNANQTAVALSPQDAEAHSNLGNTLKEVGRLEEAEASYSQAIALKADYAEAHYNLGVILKELGRLEEAEASYSQAIALKSNFAEAYYNLGNTLKELGRLDEAEASCRHAIALKPDYADAILNLSIVLDFTNNLDAATHSLKNILNINTDNQGLRAGVILAIFRFLEGDFVGSRKYLLAASSIQEKTSSIFKSEKPYHGYLLKILNWHEDKYFDGCNTKIDKTLYVIGESHCLNSHQLHVQRSGSDFMCKSMLIVGCKQWHLGNSSRNQYKNKFENIFCSLPKSSEVLLAIGEIDCRLDSGIMKHKNKFPEKEIEEIIVDTVENYLTYIAKNNSGYQHNIIIQGVPCPNIDTGTCSEKEVTQLIEVIKKFNCELKKKSKKKGFEFLDVHKLTDRGDGFSNAVWHIDNFHLSPEGFLEAWSRYVSE